MSDLASTILITGARGFVGGHLSAELYRRGLSFKTASREIIASTTDSISLQNSLCNSEVEVETILTDVNCIIHLAARVHIMSNVAGDPLSEFSKVNFHDTTRLASRAAANGVKRFVFVSSVKVNGESTLPGHVCTEDHIPNPQDPYAISKLEAEQELWEISKVTGMEVVIVRPPLVYGPKVKANFANLLKLVDSGIPMPLSSIHNLRSLIYVGNLVDALITCATHPAAAGKTYLVSDGEDVSTPQLINAIATALERPNRNFPLSVSLMRALASLFGKTAAIDRLTQSLVVDSSKIRQELGWKPPIAMAEGLRITAEWYRQAKARQ